MRIVLFMTGKAVRRQLLAVKITFVAGIAFGLPVFAAQLELRLLIMIEIDDVPFLRAMAIVAFRPVTPFVNILQLMTHATDRADVPIALAAMA